MKLKSDRLLSEILRSGNRSWVIGVLLLLGVILIFIGGSGISKSDTATATVEERAAEMCSMIDGVGECHVMMTYHPDDDSRVYAVLVLCDGADSVKVRESVTSLFCSLYGIGANRVEVRLLNK